MNNGLEFRNELLSELCRLLGVARCFTTLYQPCMNAVCERSHATVNAMLAKCVADNHRDWDEWLPQVAFCYNASLHESTHFTPFFLMHGTEPHWDVDFKLGTEDQTAYSVNAYTNVLLKRLEGAYTLTREHLQTTATRMSDWYNQKVKVQELMPGDEVYVLNLRLYQSRYPKWLRRYSDVATVIREVTDVVRGDACRAKEKVVHVNKLKLKLKAGTPIPPAGTSPGGVSHACLAPSVFCGRSILPRSGS